MRHVCPGATVDQLLTWLRKRTKQEFASFLDKEENADVIDDVLEADDRKDAKETKKTGQASHVFKAQVAEVVRGLKLPAGSSCVAAELLKSADVLDAKAACSSDGAASGSGGAVVPKKVANDELREKLADMLPKVIGCRIQLVEARRCYYAEYPREVPPRSHTKTWAAEGALGLTRERSLRLVWKWAWLAHIEKEGGACPYDLDR